MEKPTELDRRKQLQSPQPPLEALKCPRCDSSNTKFCYYNNYSLSQPRHFCKACKRYWTRGGTLRNVPVGGGCRKNKKIKRSISAVDPPQSSSPSPTATPSNHNTTQPQIDYANPLTYGLPTKNPSPELNVSYNPSFSSRVSCVDTVSGFVEHLHPQMSRFDLGFCDSGNYQNGFDPNEHLIQDSNSSLISSYSSFGPSTSPTIASLLGSRLHQQKFICSNDGSQGLVPFQDLQMEGNVNLKMPKREERRNYENPNCQHQTEQINPFDSTLYLNATNVGAWLDPTTFGYSVPSLI